MKKLITIMASMATCLLFGDGFTNSGTSFEEYGDRAFDPATDDAGVSDSNTYWLSTGDGNDAFVLTNYDGVASANTPAGVPRPDYFAASNNATFLAIDTSARLYRSAMANSQTTSFNPVSIPADKGIYLDTLVKFTAAEDETGLVLEGTDKIAIAYVEHEDLETPENSYTNFVICAGYLGSPLSVTNYFAAVPADFDKDAWHRLTVRSFASIDAAGDVGFVVYLDQEPLAYGTAVDAGDGFVATGAAAAFYTSELHALYPSAVPADQLGGSAIAAVAFTGNGSVDDVTFTTETPNFIKAGEQVRTEITLGTGVASVTVTVGGNTINPEDAAASPLVFNLPAGTTSFVLGVTAAATYTFDETTGITLTDATYDAATDTVSFDAGSAPALTVKGSRNNFSLFDEKGDPISGTFETLGAALAAQGVAKIQLAYDYDVTDADLYYGGYISIDQSTTLDLNGKTLDGGVSVSDPLFFVNDGNFVIIDSVGGGRVVYDGPGIVFGATAYIGAANDDLGPTFDGKLFYDGGEGYVIRGKFNETSNTANGAEPAFLYMGSLIDDESGKSECKGLVSGYWVVEPTGGSEPEVIAVPTAETGLVYDGTEKIGVVAGTGYTLTGNIATNAGNYTATATLEDGYVWSDTTTEAKSINWSIAVNAGATVDLTLASEIAEYTELLDFPAVTAKVGTEDVTGTPVWDPAKISEPNAGETNTYTVTFTVMNGGYTGSTGTATFKVFKAAQSGGWDPKPEDIDPSATAATKYPELDGTALATANAKKLTEWAEAKSIDFAAVKGGAGDYVDAFLLNCAPDAVEAAKADFKATITVNADGTVTVTAPGDYNVTPTIQGKQTLSNSEEWHAKTDDDQFFRAVLSL